MAASSRFRPCPIGPARRVRPLGCRIGGKAEHPRGIRQHMLANGQYELTFTRLSQGSMEPGARSRQ